MNPLILIVEDDPSITELLKTTLSLKQYKVIETMHGKEGVNLAKERHPDLVVLDLMLPDMNGYDVCRALKSNEQTKTIPILMLTARDKVHEIVQGLEAGANDYLTKPFEVVEFMARVGAQLRLAEYMKTPPKRIEREGVVIDRNQHIVKVGEKFINDLTLKEFEILYTLMKNSPKTLSRNQISMEVWEAPYKEGSRTIDIHIQKIRDKIGGKGAERLISIKGEGYKFV